MTGPDAAEARIEAAIALCDKYQGGKMALESWVNVAELRRTLTPSSDAARPLGGGAQCDPGDRTHYDGDGCPEHPAPSIAAINAALDREQALADAAFTKANKKHEVRVVDGIAADHFRLFECGICRWTWWAHVNHGDSLSDMQAKHDAQQAAALAALIDKDQG